MAGGQRGSGVGVKVLLFVAIASVTLSACARIQTADDRPSAAPATPSAAESPVPSPCPAPALDPGYLPEDVRPVEREPLFALPERTRTWENDDVLVQLLEGFSADHGEDASVKTTSVRGDVNANVSSAQSAAGETLLVDWAEQTRCGHKQYAVATTGLDEEETLRIAQELE